jgi:O-methyltransferase involved in polyketide biosynthesis
MHPLRWLRPGSHTISPTALYTGQVWQAHGLGHPALAPALGSLPGRVGYAASELAFRPVAWSGGPTLTAFLLARHRIIDALLQRAVEAGEVGQVVELAAGLSPRGLRLRAAHPEVDYVEVDLPDMTARKRRALTRAGVDPARHRAVAADVFGPELDELFTSLDARRGVAVVTEGLLNYFPTEAVTRLWGRIATATRDLPRGLYLSDLHLDDHVATPDRVFAAGLGLAVRGGVHFHFEDAARAQSALTDAGFTGATLHRPADFSATLPGMTEPGAGRVRVVEAWT